MWEWFPNVLAPKTATYLHLTNHTRGFLLSTEALFFPFLCLCAGAAIG